MTQLSPAWMLDCGGGLVAAAPVENVLHVIEDTSLLFHVPLAPAHCNRILLWQQRVLPAVDLPVLFTGSVPATKRLYACVLGWRDVHGDTEYGVLLTRGLPRRIAVSDEDQAQPANNDAERWRGIALGFFSYHKRITPIIDPAAIFGSAQQSAKALGHGRREIFPPSRSAADPK